MKKLFCLLLAALVLLPLLPACQKAEQPSQSAPDNTDNTPEDQQAELPEQDDQPPQEPEHDPDAQPAPEPVRICLTAVGDNLLHNTVSTDCKTEGGGFDYVPLYHNIAPFAQKADLAFINQEVPLAGEVGTYPTLSGPAEVAPGLKETGFNIVNLATNHSLDKGQKGLLTSIENIKAQSFDAVLGCYASQEEADAPILVEKQGVTFGFLSYTYGTNGIPVPSDKRYLVSLIDEGQIEREMAALRPQCDVLIVSLHWGNEYQLTPSDEQRALGQKVADWGADIIIGHHPHVLQPMEMLTRQDGGQTLCVYSLGNFVSGQHKMNTMLGGLLWCELVFTPGQEGFAFENAGIVPLVTHYEGKGRDFDIIPLSDYTPELAEKHGIVNFDSKASVEYFQDLATRVLGDHILTPEQIL